jgi:hypothetical protein
MRPQTRFAIAFAAAGSGTDLETYHPLDVSDAAKSPLPKTRDFLAGATLTIWLVDDLDQWEAALRRPVWPLRFGRSQDLASARTRRVQLADGQGRQRQAVVPAALTSAGTLLQLPTAVSEDRSRTRWDAYRYAAQGGDCDMTGDYATEDGRAVVLLPPVHPSQLPIPAAS